MNIRNAKLGELVIHHSQLLNCLNRLDIELGFGDKTVEEICEEKKIDLNFFSELLQLIISKYDFNPKYIDYFETKFTVGYLRRSHQSYINDYIPMIEKKIDKLGLKESNRKSDSKILTNYFKDYKTEFAHHLDYEDNTVFPYILTVEQSYIAKAASDEIKQLIAKNSIKIYAKHHDSLNEKLNDLKSLLIKYFKPFKDFTAIHSLLKTLFELEEDLKYHELIENQILFPHIKKMEKFLVTL